MIARRLHSPSSVDEWLSAIISDWRNGFQRSNLIVPDGRVITRKYVAGSVTNLHPPRAWSSITAETSLPVGGALLARAKGLYHCWAPLGRWRKV